MRYDSPISQIARITQITYHAVIQRLKIGFIGLVTAAGLLCASVTAAHQITLAWDANTESDLEGYIIYGRKWSPCPPYDYIDTIPITELADPENPKLRIANLDKHVIYFFVVTAYDTEGLESGYSNIVSSNGEVVQCHRGTSNNSGGSNW